MSNVLLVNTAPGDSSDPVRPEGPVWFGLRSQGGLISVGSIESAVGFTGLEHSASVLPEDDERLSVAGAGLSIETAERARPVGVNLTRALSGGSIILTKTSNSNKDSGIYEVTAPVDPADAILASITFRLKTAWQVFSPPWSSFSDMVCPFIGLEYGPLNTGFFVFLRKHSGTGRRITGGIQTFDGAVRSAEAENSDENWAGFANNTVYRVQLLIRPRSKELILSTASGTNDLVALSPIDLSTLGTYPSGGFSNIRTGPSNIARFYFGNVGRTGDILQIDDWVLFPAYRPGTLAGQPLANQVVSLRPNCPTVFEAANLVNPQSLRPDRWFSAGETPKPTPVYGPGFRSKPKAIAFTRDKLSEVTYSRREPASGVYDALTDIAVVGGPHGAMFESLLRCSATQTDGDSSGSGFEIRDGDTRFRVALISYSGVRTIGLLKSYVVKSDAIQGYYVPVDGGSVVVPIDWEKDVLVRLVTDKRRSKVSLFVGDMNSPILVKSTSDLWPAAPDKVARSVWGHLDNVLTNARLEVRRVFSAPQYLAWEGTDNKLPGDVTLDANVKFTTAGAASQVMTSTLLKITGGTRTYRNTHLAFVEKLGGFVDFRMKILSWTDSNGLANPINTSTNACVRVELESKTLFVQFFDAGVYGKKVGIRPGSADIGSDLFGQTSLGRRFSVDCDWTVMHSYRLVVRAFEHIELFIDNLDEPALSIPWTDAVSMFNLDPVVTGSRFIGFGHDQTDGSSTWAASTVSEWAYFRWGAADGCDISLEPGYPNGRSDLLFNGRCSFAGSAAVLP